MHEHGGEKRIEPLSRHHVGGNHSEVEDSSLKRTIAQKPEKEEDDHVNYYEDPCDVGSRQRTIFVSKGNQAIPPRAWF